LDGRTHSSSAPRYQNVNNHIQITRPAVARFSALQNTTDNNVTSLTGDVNRTIEDLIEKLSQESSFLRNKNALGQNSFGEPNVLGQKGVQSDAFWQNPYNNIMPVKSREEEELEELLKKPFKGILYP